MLRRRIKKADVQFVSLVPRGANKQPVLYKADGIEVQTLTKEGENFDERGELLSIVYPADFLDSQGDIASAEVVKGMAYSHMRNGPALDIRHNGKSLAKEQIYVAESFLVQKGDPRFVDWKDYDGKPVDTTGSWAQVYKIQDPALRKLYREGGWNGVSLFGPAEFEATKDADLETLLEGLVKRLNGKETEDMDPKLLTETIEKALAAHTATILKAVDDKLAKSGATPPAPPAPPASPATDTPIVFKGDSLCRADVEKHLAAIKKAKLAKAIDWNDPEAVEKHLAENVAEKGDDTDGGGEDEESSEDKAESLKLLKAENAKLRKSSNQAPGEKGAKLSKDAEAYEEGGKISTIANARRGYGKAQ